MISRRRFLLDLAAISAAVGIPSSTAAPVQDRFGTVPLNQVKVAGLIGDRFDLTWRGNILALDVDQDFLGPFVQKKENGDFIGLGMFTDAVVHFAFQTADPKLIALKEHLVEMTAQAQESDGYVGLLPPGKRIREPWDISEMAYIIYGLTSDYRLFGERRSLETARRMGDYMVTRLSGRLPDAVNHNHTYLEMVMTGFPQAMLALYKETGDARYLDVVTKDCKLQDWKLDIIQGRREPIYGHAYAYLCQCLEQLELFHITPDDRLFSQSEKALNFLRREHGMVITGMSGKSECWHSDQSGDGNLIETCSAAYYIRWLDQLLRMRGDSLYGDMIERAVYNTLFAAQSPDGRRLRYYTAFEGPRVYWKPDTYCCPNNYRRLVAELPGMIYYAAGGGLLVDLYTQSSATVQLAPGLAMRARQETDYPSSGTVILHLDPARSAVFPLKLRIPRWCNHATLAVNGKSVPIIGPGFANIQRRWKSGDIVELKMDMPWRLIRGVAKQEGRAAVMRGPVVYCLNPERNPSTAAIDLKEIVLDASGFNSVRPDNEIRKNGTLCELPAWRDRLATTGEPNLRVTLTEFPDPGGTATYFHIRNGSLLVGDELLTG